MLKMYDLSKFYNYTGYVWDIGLICKNKEILKVSNVADIFLQFHFKI